MQPPVIPDYANQHYVSLKQFLDSYLSKSDTININSQRQSARDKLKRLTDTQFQELSTDVFDEMNRRESGDADVPFLPVENDFHPKRNQARQKLATLSENRFRDLACDVFFELERRYPSLVTGPVITHFTEKPSNPAVPARPPPTTAPPSKPNLLATADTVKKPKTAAPLPTATAALKSEPSTTDKTIKPQKSTDFTPGSTASVNLESLDNLMADLGNLIGSSTTEPNASNDQHQQQQQYSGKTTLKSGSFKTGATNDRLIPSPNNNSSSTTSMGGGVRRKTEESVQQLSRQTSSNSLKSTTSPANNLLVSSNNNNINNNHNNNSGGGVQEMKRVGVDAIPTIDHHQKQKLLDEHLGKFKSENEKLMVQISKLQADNEKLKSEAQGAARERDELGAELSRMKMGHDDTIRNLTVKINGLEKKLKDQDAEGHKDRAKRLDETVKILQEENKGLKQKMESFEKESATLREEVERERAQVTKFSKDIALLNSQIDELHTNEQMVANMRKEYEERIVSLKSKIEPLQRKLEESQAEVKRLESALELSAAQAAKQAAAKQKEPKATFGERLSKVLDLNQDSLYKDNGKLSVSDVTQFKNRVVELVRASNENNPINVVSAMKSIVISTKNLTDKIEKYENDHGGQMSSEDLERAADLRTSLGENLATLLDATKQHANGTNVQSTIEKAAEELGRDILGIIKVLHIYAGPPGVTKRPSRDQLNSRSSSFSLKDTDQPEETSRKTSDISKTAPNQSPTPATRSPNGNTTIQPPTGATTSNTNQQQQPTPDYHIDDLRAFLEQQTDQIVYNIQALLQEMRQPIFGKEFTQTIEGITSVVHNLIKVSRTTLAKPILSDMHRSKGHEILHLLSESNGRLGEMAEAMISNVVSPSQKPSKQKLAAAAYEVAKNTKALVTLFDVQ